jgi:hypothetical protein
MQTLKTQKMLADAPGVEKPGYHQVSLRDRVEVGALPASEWRATVRRPGGPAFIRSLGLESITYVP